METVEDIRHIMYINLDERLDRLIKVQGQLQRVFPTVEAHRFSAVKHERGAYGCTMSHIACLEHAIRENWDHVLICEDDIGFLDVEEFRQNVSNALKILKGSWDVMLIAGNNVGPYVILNQQIVRVMACQTTTGYLVKREYMERLLENFQEGFALFRENPTMARKYAIDQYWFLLQKKDRWFLVYPLTVTQLPDYSDIEKKVVNYNHLMLTLDKAKIFGTKLRGSAPMFPLRVEGSGGGGEGTV